MAKRYRVVVELQDLEGADDGYTVVTALEQTFASLEVGLSAVSGANDAVLIARAEAEMTETPEVPSWS